MKTTPSPLWESGAALILPLATNEPVKDTAPRVGHQGRSKSKPVKYATSESSFDPLFGSETVLEGGDARQKLRGLEPVVALRRGSGN